MCFTGFKADGSLKVRPIDDLSASKVNSTAVVTEKLKYDSLDTFFELLRFFESRVEVVIPRSVLSSIV